MFEDTGGLRQKTRGSPRWSGPGWRQGEFGLDGLDYLAHDPGVFPDLTDLLEVVLIEQLGRAAEQEPTLRLPAVCDLGNRLPSPPPRREICWRAPSRAIRAIPWP